MLLEVKNISKSFGKVKAVDNVSFSVEEGDSVGLVGESGSGKTTLARILLGLLKPDLGDLQFLGRDRSLTYPYNISKIAQIVFQDPQNSLNPRMKIGEALEEPIKIHKTNAKVAELLELVGLPKDYANRYPNALSGGERQRVGIARALAVEPKFLILDEPVSALDLKTQVQILNLLKDLKSKLNLTYLFIAHDLSVIKYLCNRILVMYKGRIIESGPAELVFSSPAQDYTKRLLASVL
ncbi:hypothetical protein A2276_08415 [candidate division WOR-1 bacterium RIFOXYA12_FULL_43_27]|uniref:ABC transporter domain-containing protein n=1 Tax=candidate division WOR-1 bacterium RIFOXYC2_FULL_46_14 TaxID=1802587 RepID=A0A1F4U659_UNCSA|nr:MAG: hypothetical protein A2276_08415 [candidate division WOR-1 bacterium RIFOXYA12_FULL_43_27]OGC20614.1 MAG: hypothetical protein A2292_06240 [candidate division WOR-1 bacterium RIFOXYB2_FULL_46_45]OGC31649.1 MAG: hypothetical protein A2232_05210 [candidate division WOR-1 bacterium RIFOXYA2_FULL_46_56]OGC40455.1 MAG: hypothetical protein A2438_04270 [candidate division WOR-1 bacterium RIFOXYC2_FULL_46_14]